MERVEKSWLILLAALVWASALAFVGCGRKNAEEAAPVVRPVKTIVVGGVTSGEVSFPATVEAGEKAVLSFRVAGRLIEFPVDEGQTLQKGDLIGRLDPEDFLIAVDEAKAQFTKAETDYKRYQQLYEKNAVPLADLEFRRSQRDVAKARMDEALRNLDYTYLRTPFDGQIGRRYVENFMDVRAGQEIVDLNDVSNVEIIFDVAENLAKGVRAGWRVDVFALFDAAPGRRFPLTLKEIASRADPTTQTFRATFLMPQPEDLRLLPGMTAEARAVITAVESATEDSWITVPAIAVVGDAERGAIVWVVDPGTMTVHERPVTIGRMTESEGIIIEDGLQIGETIVVAGVTQLQEGMEVRFWEEQGR
jgi:RND family efflux transporter MFP subunit